MNEIKIYTDGGARGNPGPAAIGVYIVDEDNKEIMSIGKKIGHATNNIAEYSAILEALGWITENSEKLQEVTKIVFFLDSLLVCSQIKGLYKVKNKELRLMVFKVREKEAEIKKQIFYEHIPREQNKKADSLVNMALDNNL